MQKTKRYLRRVFVGLAVLSLPLGFTPATADHVSDAMWHEVAKCESENGRTSDNQYQFSGDTAAKVGIDGSEPLSMQTAAANDWAHRIRGSEGTSAGWPECWWTAKAAVGSSTRASEGSGRAVGTPSPGEQDQTPVPRAPRAVPVPTVELSLTG